MRPLSQGDPHWALKGKQWRTAHFFVRQVHLEGEFLFYGIIVRKKIGPAVTRNRIKRRIRHAIALCASPSKNLHSFDHIYAQNQTLQSSFLQKRCDFSEEKSQAKVVNGPDLVDCFLSSNEGDHCLKIGNSELTGIKSGKYDLYSGAAIVPSDFMKNPCLHHINQAGSTAYILSVRDNSIANMPFYELVSELNQIFH